MAETCQTITVNKGLSVIQARGGQLTHQRAKPLAFRAGLA